MTTAYKHARDIPDQVFLDTVAALAGGPHRAAFLSEVVEALDAPHKLVMAKARRLINRGLLDGCACGCRGDFQVIEGA